MGLEEIKYLTHFTTARNLPGIIRDGSLLTGYDRWRRRTSYEGNASTGAVRGAKFRVNDEFPGVFMSWHLGGETPSPYGDITLVFGRDLVREQKNFHLNLADKNGFFIEGGTYFRGDDVPRLEETRAFKMRHGLGRADAEMNEIVFHDSVSMALCEAILVSGDAAMLAEVKASLPAAWAAKTRRLRGRGIAALPVAATRTTRPEMLNTTSLACRVFRTDIGYTGFRVAVRVPGTSRARYRSGVRYVRDIARLAGVDDGTLARLRTAKAIERHMTDSDLYTACFLRSGRASVATKGGA